MQYFKPTPAHGALNLVEGSLLSDQHLQRFAVQLVIGFEFTDGDAGVLAHGSVVVDEALRGIGVEVAIHLKR
jgi:hypothetical protein